MTPSELYEIYYVVLATMDQIFEFWLTASFAVILACYFANDILTRGFYALISSLYIVLSLAMLVRYILAATKMGELRERLIVSGEVFEPLYSLIIGILLLVLFLAATLGTLFFIRKSYEKARGS